MEEKDRVATAAAAGFQPLYDYKHPREEEGEEEDGEEGGVQFTNMDDRGSSKGAAGNSAPPGGLGMSKGGAASSKSAKDNKSYEEMNSAWLAMSRFRRRKFDESIDLCTRCLAENPRDQAVWYMKVRGLTQKAYIDDMDMEEEAVGDLLLDENAMAKAPRPGTSLKRPMTGAQGGGGGSGAGGMRPLTSSGRPMSGFARPGTQSNGGGRPGEGVEGLFRGNRPGTSRPVSVAGRFIRLGTASLVQDGEQFINLDRFDFNKYAQRPALAKVLMDYILYCEHTPKRALDLGSACTVAAAFKDWWWKARLAKAYYQLGMLRDAEKQFKSALVLHRGITLYLELAKVYIKLDQPLVALATYTKGLESFPLDTTLLTGVARIHEGLGQMDKSQDTYRQVLALDPSSVEAIACLASTYFYNDHPEIALRLYRRLLQMNVNNTEIWNNIGLCCFYASQYDMALSCFEKALKLGNDNNTADVWFNVGMIAIGIGDSNLAYQAFKVAISVDASSAESFNNLGILELRKGNVQAARSHFETARKLAGHLFEPFFSGALVSWKLGDCQESYELAQKALQAFPDHTDTKELLSQLKKQFMSV